MRTVLFLAALLVLVVPAVAQTPRIGAEVRYATLDSSGGVQGSAFLPIAPSDVRPRARDATCANARLEIRARGLRGLVRDLRITMPDVSSVGDVALGTGCEEATVRAKLEDGSEVEGSGSMRVDEVHREGAVRLVLALEWQPRVRGRTLPMSWRIVVPTPPAP